MRGIPDWTNVDWIALFGHFFVKGLTENTHKVYSSGQRRFLKFCAMAGLVAVPAREEVLCKFVYHRRLQQLPVS